MLTRLHRAASPISTRATTFALTTLRPLRISTWTATFTFESIRPIRISAIHIAMLTRIHRAASPITTRATTCAFTMFTLTAMRSLRITTKATTFTFETMHRSFNISARSPVFTSRATWWSVVATISIFVLSEGGGRCRDSDRRSE
ncbi:hypothetical protein [Rosistilla oblonga]|uniref:hypothetical protein n=1 Tax=Rosistilla oblonga TaxID=2527990 RepID=UPI0011A778CE|nr:hypothetical protein [Rosistilla oblonga]